MYANILGMVAVVGSPRVVAALVEAGLRAGTPYVVQPNFGRRCRVIDQVANKLCSSTTFKEKLLLIRHKARIDGIEMNFYIKQLRMHILCIFMHMCFYILYLIFASLKSKKA